MNAKNIPKKYSVKLVEKESIAKNTMGFTFERPGGFSFRAGQFITITIPKIPDVRPYAFSIASPPSDNEILLAMRMSDSKFKKAISRLSLGYECQIQGPFGKLGIHDTPGIPAVFLAGGMGIAPFRSIILDEEDKGFPVPIILFDCNREPKTAAFFHEFESIKNKNFRLIPVMEFLPKGMRGECGLISKEILKKHVPNLAQAVFYVVGPEAMVDCAQKLLTDLPAVDKNKIVIEEF